MSLPHINFLKTDTVISRPLWTTSWQTNFEMYEQPATVWFISVSRPPACGRKTRCSHSLLFMEPNEMQGWSHLQYIFAACAPGFSFSFSFYAITIWTLWTHVGTKRKGDHNQCMHVTCVIMNQLLKLVTWMSAQSALPEPSLWAGLFFSSWKGKRKRVKTRDKQGCCVQVCVWVSFQLGISRYDHTPQECTMIWYHHGA